MSIDNLIREIVRDEITKCLLRQGLDTLPTKEVQSQPTEVEPVALPAISYEDMMVDVKKAMSSYDKGIPAATTMVKATLKDKFNVDSFKDLDSSSYAAALEYACASLSS